MNVRDREHLAHRRGRAACATRAFPSFGLAVHVLVLVLLCTAWLAARAATFRPRNAAELRTAISNANATAASDTILLSAGVVYAFTNADNAWYGPNALPPISSPIVIVGRGAVIERGVQPATPPFRLFYVSSGASDHPAAGSLTLREVTLRGGFARYTVIARDQVNGAAVPLVCAPLSGSVFPLGNTPVLCRTVDRRGNSNHCVFPVSVVDSIPPAMLCPADLALDAPDPAGAMVSFPMPSASDLTDSNLLILCAPPPGSLFPVGRNVVACSATDRSENRTSCAFTITMHGARGIQQDVLALLMAWRSRFPDRTQRLILDQAIGELNASLAPAFWIDEHRLARPTGLLALSYVRQAAGRLVQLLGLSGSQSQRAAGLRQSLNRTVASVRLLALAALADASAAGGDADIIADALAHLAEGDVNAAERDYEDALDDYRHAWDHALDAVEQAAQAR